MPSQPHSSFVQAGSFWELADFRLSPTVRRGLRRPGSLSSRMQKWCKGALPVRVVQQGSSLPTRDEARLLGLGFREWVWVREVRLGPLHGPWVKGRTVVPLKEMHGSVRDLRNLGDRPLGSVLFNGQGWHRGPFLIGRMDAAELPGHLPARRSVFYHGNSRLLVTEGFYPAYWQRLQQEQAAAGSVPHCPAPAPDRVMESP